MRRPEWWALSVTEQDIYHSAFRFLSDRLEERETIAWALKLKPEERAKRFAIRELLSSGRKKDLSATWREAWYLIIENWTRPVIERNSHTGVYEVRQRLVNGENMRGVVSAILELVTPRLDIRMTGSQYGVKRKNTKRPKSWEDIISCTLTSGSLLEIDELKLETIVDRDFLFTLATALDDLLVSSLDLARRIGWDGEHNYWVIGEMHRVYYVRDVDEDGRKNEPDDFADGLVPAVKLLYEVLARLANVDLASVTSFVVRWKPTDSQVHLRLLAALYRNPRMVSNEVLNSFFMNLNDRQFWDLRRYPEVGELRAKRFNDLGPEIQTEILKRIKKGPPSSHWPRAVDRDRVKDARQHNAVQEMKRIQLAGGNLPQTELDWLEERLLKFPELVKMKKVEEGFPEGMKAHSIEPKPDLRFDALQGEERLSALEVGLVQKRSWFDEKGNAGDWIRVPGNCLLLISDFESVGDGGASYSNVWDRFGWTHSPADGAKSENNSEGTRILKLIEKLPIRTIEKAINGISHWIYNWRQFIPGNDIGNVTWLKVWPIAVAATNVGKSEDEIDLNTVAKVVGDGEPKDLDTLNTPAGKLISVFLKGCPTLAEGLEPFGKGKPLRVMRDAIFSASGRTLLIAQYRSVENLTYFLHADQEWADKYLIEPILSEDTKALVLWRAISRRIQRPKALHVIGDEMASRALDLRLGRESRCMLVRNLVIECLHAYWFRRDSAVGHPKVQQTLRSVEDEVRSAGAEILQRFISDSANSQKSAEDPIPLPEDLYFRAVKPFFQEVWPQERSLSTPGVSRALADLPSTVGNAFTDAVDMIERFLVPFECWSLGDFGFYGVIDDQLKFEKIDSHEKASAFLRLLDRSIGTQENAVIPHELADALDQIRQVNPKLSETRPFRRLEAASRR